MAKNVEPYDQAGIGGSDIGDEGFRLASGVAIGPALPGNPTPKPPPPPPSPPAPTVRRSMSLVGHAPPVRPELIRDKDTIDGQSSRLIWRLAVWAVFGVAFVALMVWLNLAHRL